MAMLHGRGPGVYLTPPKSAGIGRMRDAGCGIRDFSISD
jgi:hypothetical protein